MYHVWKKFLPLIMLICCPISGYGAEQVRIINARVAEAPPVMEMNAAYLDINNDTPSPVTLVSVSSADFSRIEIHRSVIENGMAKMKPTGPLTIAAHSRQIFKPGGYHLMLFKPRIHLHAGDIVGLKFHFANGTTIEADAKVVKISQ